MSENFDLTNVTKANQTSFWQTTRKFNDTHKNEDDMDESEDDEDDVRVEMIPVKVSYSFVHIFY